MISSILHNGLVYIVRLVKCVEYFVLKYIIPGWTERYVKKALATAGVTINGDKPWDVQVHDKEFYPMIVNTFTAGIGETYMKGMWDCEDITELSYRTTKYRVDKYYYNFYNRFLDYLVHHLFNIADKKKVWESAEHYDTDNELFEAFLGKTMQYTCGYWQNAKNLEEAQIAKMDRIAKKINLEPGMTVLDIGCGWGVLASHLAKNYGVSVVGITISEVQADYIRNICKGLPVEIRVEDYRDIKGTFDRVVSVGMMEHVGPKNYHEYFSVLRRSVSDTGLIYVQTMGLNHHDFICIDPFIDKYIFPNAILGNMSDVVEGFDGRFVLEDWQVITGDYVKTLQGWYNEFIQNWPKLQKTGKYDEKFFRLWNYYLLMAPGAFRSRKVQLWQIVLSKKGIEGGYYAAY